MDDETYHVERTSLVNAEQDQSRLYDRAILTLTAGALGLSLTFIHEMVPEWALSDVWWLATGWAFLICSLLSTLISFQTSQSAQRRQRDILDERYTKGDDAEINETNRPGIITHRLNISSLVLFICGVVCLAVFVALNVGGT